MLDGVTIKTPLLYSPGARVNLLGHNALCKLGAKIQCNPTGLWVTFPKLIAAQYLLLQEKDTASREMDKVYWLETLDINKSELWEMFMEWKLRLQYMRPDCQETPASLHCTLKYDEGRKDEEFAQLWEELEEGHDKS